MDTRAQDRGLVPSAAVECTDRPHNYTITQEQEQGLGLLLLLASPPQPCLGRAQLAGAFQSLDCNHTCSFALGSIADQRVACASPCCPCFHA